jgi:hypothetical protein
MQEGFEPDGEIVKIAEAGIGGTIGAIGDDRRGTSHP